MKISTTPITPLKPVLFNDIEHIQRYPQFVELFEYQNCHLLFAQPQPAFENGQKAIAWHTDFVGNVQNYAQMNPTQQEVCRSFLQDQISNVFNIGLKHKESSAENEHLLTILEGAIEIPELTDIWMIQAPNHDTCVVLTRWGYNFNRFGAPKGLIKKLVKINVKDINFRIVYPDSRPAIGESLTFYMGSLSSKLISDNNGFIKVEDLSFGQKLVVIESDESGKTIAEYEYICSGIDEYTIIVKDKTKKNMIPPPVIEQEKPELVEEIIPTQIIPPIVESVPTKIEEIEQPKIIEKEPETIIENTVIPPINEVKTVTEELPKTIEIETPNNENKKPIGWIKYWKSCLLWLLLLLLIAALVYWWLNREKNNALLPDYQIQPGDIVNNPIDGCRMHLSGAVLGSYYDDSCGISRPFVVDKFSVLAGGGEYSNLSVAFKKVDEYTFDGFAIDSTTHIILYELPDFKGAILIDTVGPLIVNNLILREVEVGCSQEYVKEMTKNYPDSLSTIFTPQLRKWSKSNMHNWIYGSLKIKDLRK